MKYVTTQRKQLYEFLRDHPHQYFTAKQIEDALRDADVEISISAVYRNLSALLNMGVIKKTIGKNSKETSYRFIQGDDCKNEIHVTCSLCGKMFHMDHALTVYMEQQLLSQTGFQINPSKTVISGICSECRQKAERESAPKA